MQDTVFRACSLGAGHAPKTGAAAPAMVEAATRLAPAVPAPEPPQPAPPAEAQPAKSDKLLAPPVNCATASGSIAGASLKTSLVKVAGEMFWMRHHLHDRLMDKVIAGDYEADLFANVRPFLNTACTIKRGTVIDVGANHGVYAILAANMGCRVVAYEIQPRLTPLIEYNACINRLGDSVVLRPFGVAATSALAKFTATDASGKYTGSVGNSQGKPYRNTGWLGAFVNKGGQVTEDDPSAVKLVTLDEEGIRLGIKRVDVFKLDVDGFELDAINGAWELLARTSFFQFEINAGDWRSPSKPADYVPMLVRLSKLFKLFLLKPRGSATGNKAYGNLYALCPDSSASCMKGFVDEVVAHGNDNLFCFRIP
ncbi:unnamed protein product [Symbiodinium sp. CCMP2456]|nr:unnamed protein product [Symbiodinium sp. CCMP2456]